MRRLNHIYNCLPLFDKFFLEIYYRLKYKSNTKRFLLLNALMKDEEEELNDELKLLQENLHSFRQNKRRLRSDMESLILLRLLKPLKSKPSAKLTCKLYLLLASFYHEKGLFDEAASLMKKTSKLIDRYNLNIEQIEYYFLLKELYETKEVPGYANLLKQSLVALESVEFQLLNELEKVESQNKEVVKRASTDKESFNKNNFSDYKGDELIRLQRNKLIALNHREYAKSKKYLEQQYQELGSIGSKGFHLRLECLLELINVNIYCFCEQENIRLIEKLESDYSLTKNQNLKFQELKFITHFLLAKYSVLHKHIAELKKFHRTNKHEELKNKILYFELLLKFTSGDYVKVGEHLLKFPFLFTADETLSLNVRMIEIYALLILNKRSLVKYRLAALRQATLRKKNINKSRYLFMERMLNSFVNAKNQSFDIRRHYELQKNRYESENHRFTADRYGYELISLEMFLETYEESHIKEYAVL